MERNRAQEICRSPVMADVRHNGHPMYIQSVDDKSDSARVYPLTNPEQEKTVHLGELTEH